MPKGRREKTKTNELYRIAEQSGTEIICFDLPQTVSVSVLSGGGSCYIGLDPFRIETTAQERVHLAHELGHCETGAFYSLHSAAETRGRCENRADRWAIKALVPFCELLSAFQSGITDLWALAEHFDVTEDFMRKALNHYRVTKEIFSEVLNEY
ncbi:MAG: ImmA/IrrE family metallo-endopeptidase [Clostridia bacterium]|nr:ImmA/IrrE family metallo-endopeptidase [Clostridia bacterium]